jgi:uncharacterized membrane protein
MTLHPQHILYGVTKAYTMAALYVAAGINHFIHPLFYEAIMPPYLPFHTILIFISGVCEILFACLLLPLNTRRLAAWCIIVLLIAVFPANVQMAINYYKAHNRHLWIALLRLPMQLLLLWWAYTLTRPFKPSPVGLNMDHKS